MAIGWLVAVGLFLDVLGAASLAVPDLPRQYQDWFYRRTPIIRKYVTNTEKLNEMSRNQITDIDKLRPIFQKLWPAVRKTRDEDPGSFKHIEIQHANVDRGPNNTPVLEFQSPNEGATITDNYVFVGRVGDYVDSIYRVLGLGMLCCGFLIQIIAQLG